jgi:hypothetical protein
VTSSNGLPVTAQNFASGAKSSRVVQGHGRGDWWSTSSVLWAMPSRVQLRYVGS